MAPRTTHQFAIACPCSSATGSENNKVNPHQQFNPQCGQLSAARNRLNYLKAYEECLSATSTHHAPWHVVPADDKDDARLIVSQIVLDALKGLKPSYPSTTQKH